MASGGCISMALSTFPIAGRDKHYPLSVFSPDCGLSVDELSGSEECVQMYAMHCEAMQSNLSLVTDPIKGIFIMPFGLLCKLFTHTCAW